MCGALYKCFIQIKKLVLLPFKAGAGVRAPVVISKKFTIFLHDKNRLFFTIYFKLKTFAAGIFNIGGFAKNVCHNVC